MKLTWTVYDGTEATLPPHVSEVLLMRDPVYGLKLCLASTFREYAVAGWSWLPIPTPVDLEKWEALREAASRIRWDLLIRALDMAFPEDTNPEIQDDMRAVVQALAALAPKEETCS